MNNNQSCTPNQIAKYNTSKMCKINNPKTVVPAENSYLKGIYINLCTPSYNSNFAMYFHEIVYNYYNVYIRTYTVLTGRARSQYARLYGYSAGYVS